MFIAIDTSTEIAGLALVGDNEIISEFTWCCGRNHSVQLLPNLEFMLCQAKLNLSAAAGIIVASGPGGYNGLRVGLSTAKTFAFSLDIPVAGISTIEAMTYEHASLGIPVCGVINPGGGDIAAGIFATQDGKWNRQLEEQLISVDNLCSKILTRTAFCGQIAPPVAEKIKERLGEKAVILSSSGWRRPAFLAELGRSRLKDGGFDDPSSLQPLYLRSPAITPPKHK